MEILAIHRLANPESGLREDVTYSQDSSLRIYELATSELLENEPL